ncbi:insoluble domain protein [Prescottella agglutinans]|nr:insoluble domain protein [Prescottella agglutinans]
MSKHRKARKPWLAPTAVAAGIGISAVTGAGIAQAAPESGWSNPNPGDSAPDSGWSNPNPTPTAPAPAPAPEPEPERQYWTAPPPEYQNIEWRQAPTYNGGGYDSGNSGGGYNGGGYGAPIQVQDLHLPTYVEPVAPIAAPPKMLRMGDYTGVKPRWMSDTYLERTNNSFAVAEAQMATFWKSVGVDVERSDRVAAATVGGAAAGAIGSGVTAGAIGALAGGTIGGNIGLGLGGFVSVPLGAVPGLPATVIVPTTVAGTAIGAAAGAAVLGVPAAVVGGIAGAAGAGAIGAGDTLSDPREIEIPDLPEQDLDAVTTQVSDALGAQSPEVAQAVTTAVESAPQIIETANNQALAAREAVLEQPGGDQVIAALDAAAVEAQHAFGPVGEYLGEILGAAGAGVTQA